MKSPRIGGETLNSRNRLSLETNFVATNINDEENNRY